MKIPVLILLVLTFSFSTLFAQETTKNMSKAKEFIDLLDKDEFAQAENYFSDEMKSKLPAEKLEEIWKTLPSQVGKFKGLGEAKSEKSEDSESITILGKFENMNLDIQIGFDKSGKIQGFFMKPVTTAKASAETYKNPVYAKTDLFEEREVTVGSGEFALPGTLTVPKGKGKFPVVIIVHGSGPNDRDGTHVNPANKPYKDLAFGLASKGVAVLRYEKRTKQYGSKLASDKTLTVKEEVIDDVLAAVELLQKMETIDAKKIYVLGHSLGGYLIPRIAERGDKIAGFISFAGATQHLEDAFLEQNTYFANLDGKITKDEQIQLDALKNLVAKIKSLSEKDLDSTQIYIGAYPAYWIDLKNYEPTKEAKSIKKPFLILQGERDYQVTAKDFENWKKALNDKKNVTFKSYPKLNHLFMSGEGTPSPAEYSKTNHVEEKVITDIADWILKTSK